MKKKFPIRFSVIMFLMLCVFVQTEAQQNPIPRDTMIVAATEIITSAPYCALVTVDTKGQPQVRTMNPFPFKGDFVVWFATSRTSNKVEEIKRESRVCVYFADHKAPQGYVNLMGKATIIDDKDLLKKMKRDYWDGIPNWQDVFVLIKIEPVSMEVINYKHKVNGNPGAPSIEFPGK
jgi:general stress protein 26